MWYRLVYTVSVVGPTAVSVQCVCKLSIHPPLLAQNYSHRGNVSGRCQLLFQLAQKSVVETRIRMKTMTWLGPVLPPGTGKHGGRNGTVGTVQSRGLFLFGTSSILQWSVAQLLLYASIVPERLTLVPRGQYLPCCRRAHSCANRTVSSLCRTDHSCSARTVSSLCRTDGLNRFPREQPHPCA